MNHPSSLTSKGTAVLTYMFCGSTIRINTSIDGQPWFCAADVCAALEYANSRDAIRLHCRQGGVAKHDTPTDSGIQPMVFIDEGNLYRLTIKSHKPHAKQFEAWVCDEVLPSIRKTGTFQVAPITPAIDKDTELAIKQRARVLADSFYPLYCLQLRHAIKSNQLAIAHIPSWLPVNSATTTAPAFGLHGEPHSRWTVCYDAEGLPQVKKMPELSRVVDLADFVALSDLIAGLRRKYEPPIQRKMPTSN